MAHKSPPILEIHFDGADISPDKVPVRALSDALAAVQRLVAGVDGLNENSAKRSSDEADTLRLVGVRTGSAVYQVSGPPPAPVQTNLRAVGLVLNHPDEVDIGNDYILKPVKNLSDIGRRLGCDIKIREPGSKKAPGAILARIGPESYDILSESWLIGGETTLFGRVERVGGATGARCGLRVPFRERMLICKVADRETARRIGTWLYKDVTASGTAQWVKHSFRLFSFTIKTISRPDQGTIADAMKELRAAGGAAWDSIADPDAYLEEVRRES